jgi:hypothetical protein
MNLDLEPKYIELAMDIPTQPGLSFDVRVNFQNVEELPIQASALWVSWFPCANPGIADEYLSGLLSGQFRILEHWRGKRAAKAEPQRPSQSGWKIINTRWVVPYIPWPKKTFKVVQNLLGAEAVPEQNDLRAR